MPEAEMKRFRGKVAVVTGAARGIGESTARRLASEGCSVLLVDLADEVTRTASDIGELCRALRIDITSAEAGKAIAEATLSEFGKIDILVNNAGIGGSKPLRDSDDETITRMIDTNLAAMLRVTRDIAPHVTRPGGRIVNVASMFGMFGYRATVAYAVSKAGVIQFTRQQAAELGPQGILVNGIAPGVVVTKMTEQYLKDPAYIRAQVDPIPIGRTCGPEEQAAVIAFLASEDASYIAGVTIPVDGGYTATRHIPN